METDPMNGHLLLIEASPRGADSWSRHIAAARLRAWNGPVVRRDTARDPIPPVTAEWIGASFTPEEQRTPAQREVLALSDRLWAELEGASEIVIATPVHNFGPPVGLKAWVDQVVRAGRTLPPGRRATVVIAAGGEYSARQFVEPWLRQVLKYLGVTEVEVRVEATAGRSLAA
jgi:FMN-dependent NADH-azoreductase